jgi:Tol biopolymer transport system component
VTVTAPPEAPRPSPLEEPLDVEAQEALIKEARRRARRRQAHYAGSALAVGAIALAVFGFSHRGGSSAGQSGDSAAPSAPAPISPLPARANGLLTIEDRKSLDVTNPDTLFVVNADDFGLRPLTHCQGGTPGDCFFGAYAWSPDGKRLAFLSGHVGGAITVSNLFLFVVNSDGTGSRRLARCGDCDTGQNPSWSPDGRRIVFATPNLAIVNVVTGAQQRLGVSGSNPVWSPGGTRIAFGLGGGLYSIKPDGSGLAQLASTPGEVGHPAWSPDGTRIAFDAPDGMYVVDADGSNLRLLPAGSLASGPSYPSWSPRGTLILFESTPRGVGGYTAEVWVVKPDGSGRRRLYRSQCCDGLWSPPIWSPDGRAIAVGMSVYTANGITRKGILVMDAQGHHRRRVFGNPEAIAWQSIPRAS